MTIDRKKFDWNINTLISTATFIVALITIAGLGYAKAGYDRDLLELKSWQIDHDKTVETRLIENRTLRGQTEERIKTAERQLFESERRVDQTIYRVTVLETALATQQAQQLKLTEVLAELTGDMKVVKELVQRMDAANKRRTP